MTTCEQPDTIHMLKSGQPVDGDVLRGMSLAGADLSGAHLAGVDLCGVDLSGAQLFKANLSGANLHGANLENAEMTGADLSGTNLAEANLRSCGLGMATLAGASMMSADLSNCTLTNADLTGIKARCTNLAGARMREATMRDADLGDADLRGVDMSMADVHGVMFSCADLRQACLRHVSGYRTANWTGADLRDINFAGAYDLRRFAIDQNYIDEFRRRNRVCGAIYHVWSLTSDCGRSFTLWFAWIAAVVLLFSLFYTMVDIDFGAHRTWLSPLYFSVVTMSTLGYGDVLPASMWAQSVAMLEVTTGYVMLGILLTLFNNKIARRAD